MKTKFFNILSMMALFVSLCSCEDFFEIIRPQESPWTTTATYEQGISGNYQKIHWNGPGYYQMFENVFSGTLVALGSNGFGLQFGEEMYYRKFGTFHNQLNDFWNNHYQVITMANLAIQLDTEGNGNAFKLDVNGGDYKNNYVRQVAENYFCRAYSYLFLCRIFYSPYDHNGNNSMARIPFKTTPAASKDDILNEKFGTREEFYQQIISDLKYAKANLPDKFTLNTWNDLPGYPEGRANKWVACALLGKVYFLMGRYADAKTEFDELINYAQSTGAYSLEEAPKDVFNKMTGIYCKETIWEWSGGNERRSNYWYAGMAYGLRFRDSHGDDLFNSSQSGVGASFSSWGGFAIAYTALKQMGWMADPMNGDYTITPAAEADLRYQQVYHLLKPMPEGVGSISKGSEGYLEYESQANRSHLKTPHVYIDKFMRAPERLNGFNCSKVPLIRLADIYLLRGWIYWKTGNSQAAADDVNRVWNRANPTNPNKHTAANISHETIWEEYLREMTGEGWTWEFIKGTQMNCPRGDDPLIPACNPPFAEWSWPIPPNETSLNHNYD